MGKNKVEHNIKLLVIGIALCVTTGILSSNASNATQERDFVIPEIQPSAGELYFDGMYYLWSCTMVVGSTTTMSVNDSFSMVTSTSYFIESLFGNRTVTEYSRLITNVQGSSFIRANSHDFIRLPTNISLGSVVPIVSMAVSDPGDQQFTVVGESTQTRMGHVFDCWRLTSSAGSVAQYDKVSGLCVTGRFVLGMMPSYYFTVNVTGTNVPLTSNLNAPVLTSPGLDPLSGPQTTMFNFSVNYADADGNPPNYMNVRINDTAYPMQKVFSGDSNYADGCWYQSVTPLQPGTYEYFFECYDGAFQVNSTTNPGPDVSASNTNSPTLANGRVVPGRGLVTTSFSFLVSYSDLDNNEPSSMSVSINGTPYAMNKEDPLDMNYMDGCSYLYTTTLAIGMYTYHFNCSDGTNTGSTGPYEGPIVSSPPYFNNMRFDYTFESSYWGNGYWNLTSTMISGMNFRTSCISNISSFGGDYWNTNFNTRLIYTESSDILAVNTHDPFWIFTNVSIGDVVLLCLYPVGDTSFTVTGETLFDVPGIGIVDAWILAETTYGCTVLYEKSTGLMLEGSFLLNIPTYSYLYSIVDTSVPLDVWEFYLSSEEVNPLVGSTTIDYNFSVSYVNVDNIAPSSIFVYIDSTQYAMTQSVPSDTNYVDGASYHYVQSTMSAGTHDYYFECTSGGKTSRYPMTGEFSGPTVQAYEYSALSEGIVSPDKGAMTILYEFTVIYQDTLNNTPSWVRVNINGTSYDMTKDTLDDNFEDGVEYTYINSTMSQGNHEYYFEAMNGSATIRFPSVGVLSGPDVIFCDYNSSYTNTAPIIDGLITAGEWSNAASYSGTMKLGSLMVPGTILRTIPYTIYIMNDETGIFICVQLSGESYNNIGSGDQFVVYCDNSLDHVTSNYDQAVFFGVGSSSPYYTNHDCYYNAAGSTYETDVAGGGTEDGMARFSHTNPVNGSMGTYTFEILMPVTSADVHDMQLTPHSQFGIKLLLADIGSYGYGIIPDFGEYGEWFDQASFGIATLVEGPASTHPPDVFPIGNSTASITWQLTSSNAPGEYRVLRNGTVIQDWVAWPGDGTITVSVDTNIGFGNWSYVIEYNDSLYMGKSDTVIAVVNDIPAVVITNLINNTMIARNLTSGVIQFTVDDLVGPSGSYEVLRNGSVIMSGAWNNVGTYTIPVNTNIGCHYFNYTIRVVDRFGAVGVESHVYIEVVRPPWSTSLPDDVVEQNATSNLVWRLFTEHSPAMYRVLQNGESLGWYSWPGNDSDITIPIASNIGLGTWTYQIQYNDSTGYFGTPDEVSIIINDIPRMIGSISINNTVIACNTTESFLVSLADTIGGSGSYNLLVNGATISSESWAVGVDIQVSIDTDSGYGNYNYTVVYYDVYGSYGTQCQVFIYIAAPPTSIEPDDMHLLQNSTLNFINWTLYDREGGSMYRIHRGVDVLVNWLPWTNETEVSIEVDCDWPVGDYFYDIQFNNSRGLISADVVVVTIDDLPTIVSAPFNVSVVQHASPSLLNWLIIDGLGSGRFTLYIDGAPSLNYDNVSWINNTVIAIAVDTTMDIGVHNYTLVYWDSYGNYGVESTVFITVISGTNPFMKFLTDYWLVLVIGVAGIVIAASAIAAARKKKVMKVSKPSSKKGKRTPEYEGGSLDFMASTQGKKRVPDTYTDVKDEHVAEPFNLDESPGLKLDLTTSTEIPENQGNVSEMSEVPAPEEIVSEPPAEIPVETAAPPSISEFYCAKCAEYYKISDPDFEAWYTCPKCNALLDLVINCPSCSNPLSIDKLYFQEIKKVGFKCPTCNSQITF